MQERARPSSARGTSVKRDWCAWLPEEKSRVFESYVSYLETSYTMLSISLNEAIGLKQEANFNQACQAVGVTPDLCALLADPLAALLRAVGEHARHYGLVPNAVPLDARNFRGSRGQRSARMSALLSHVLLTQRAQFLYKISTLHEMVEDIGSDFRECADGIAAEGPDEPSESWHMVEVAHYDLNTCLREGIVLLKSFLVVLPDDQLGPFQKTVHDQMKASRSASAARQESIGPRRMAPIAGG